MPSVDATRVGEGFFIEPFSGGQGEGDVSKANTQEQPIVILRCAAVTEKTGLALSSLYELIREGDFPKPIQLSAQRVGWLQHEVEAWLRQRVEASRAPRPIRRRRRAT